ncbi:MAG: TetR/AcrR family transcriptional regulator [Rhizobium sp.]|nr:TetR/AcrR family transcriptional regulator [Rhizobium sp.]
MTIDEDCKRGTPRRKAERPTEILHAAFEEFVLTGYAATRLEDVAARAGVTKGTIYFHFQNKENVFNQMVRELSKPMHQRTQQFLDENQHCGIEFLSSYLDFSYAEVLEDRHAREILRLLIAEATRFPDLVDEHFQYVLHPVFMRLQQTLADGVRDCRIRNTPAATCPDLLLSPMLALNVFLLVFADRKPIDPKKHLEAAKDLILYGLLPRKA